MKRQLLALTALFLGCLSMTLETEARCCRRGNGGAVAAGFFAGALTGAAVASSYNNDVYYVDRPYYNAYYPAAPLYAYDYPTYAYAPAYTYAYDTRFGAPGGYYNPYYFPY